MFNVLYAVHFTLNRFKRSTCETQLSHCAIRSEGAQIERHQKQVQIKRHVVVVDEEQSSVFWRPSGLAENDALQLICGFELVANAALLASKKIKQRHFEALMPDDFQILAPFKTERIVVYVHYALHIHL